MGLDEFFLLFRLFQTIRFRVWGLGIKVFGEKKRLGFRF
jgi:hypothetical protein